MKLSRIICLVLLTITGTITIQAIDPAWTREEIYAANTAAAYPYMNQVEKDVVLYYNLARLYPQKFVRVEVAKEPRIPYVLSLADELNNLSPLPVLNVSSDCVQWAQCWAAQSGQRGLYGHVRVGCPDANGGENCDYGSKDGRTIVMNLLVDDRKYNLGTDLGHRRNALDPRYHSVGVGFATHTVYGHCCVQNFSFEQGVFYPQQQVQATPTPEQQRIQSLEQSAQNLQQTQTKPATEVVVVKKSSTDNKSSMAQKAHVQSSDRSNSWVNRFYNYSGFSSLSYFSIGYTYSCKGGNHMVNASLLDFRVSLFSASLLNVEMSVSPFDKRFSYKPNIRLHIPVAKCFSVVPYGGAEIDASYLGKYLDKNYTYNVNNDFYINAVGGLALNLTAARHVPMEINVEYRHPVLVPTAGALNPQGVYVGAKIYFGSVFYKK